MNITITVPDEKASAILDAFASQYKYQENVEGAGGELVDNPVSKKDFALGIIKSFIKDVHVANKVKELESQRLGVVENAKSEMNEVVVT